VGFFCALALVVPLYTSCVLKGTLCFYFNKTTITYQKINMFVFEVLTITYRLKVQMFTSGLLPSRIKSLLYIGFP